MRRVLRSTVIAIVAAAALIAAPAAQQPAPSRPAGQGGAGGQQPPVTFRVEIDYVEVDAVVTDEKGNLVQGLTREDFEVYEDGKLQKIELFSSVEIPVERADRFLNEQQPIPPDVKSNEQPFDGRLYVILLDDLHTAALRSQQVKRAAKQFVERHLGANDIAAVVHTSGRLDASQEFTGNPRLLMQSIDKFMGQKLRSRTLERLDEYYRQRGMEPPPSDDGSGSSSSSQTRKINDPLDFERGYKARSALGTLKNLADFLAGVRGRRKAVLYFSEGIDYPIHDIFESRDASTVLQDTREAITAAARANVNFYGIDPRGLHGMGDEIMEMQAPPEDPSYRLNPEGLQDERRLAADSLRTLSEETGGFAAVETNDFRNAFERIVNENSTYYVLGYYPPSNKRDGRFHRIEVKVKRPGLKVIARKGYAAPKGKPEKTEVDPSAGTSAALRELLNSPLQSSGLTLTVHAAPFAGTKDNVAVTVEITGRNLKFNQKDGLFHNTVEVSMLPLEARGKAQQGTRTELKLTLRPQTAQVVSATAMRVLPRLSLPPGRYQLRVAARETGGGLTGSVFYDLVVPDFTKEKLVMSGVVLTAATAQITPTASADPVLKELLPGPPTARREFYSLDKLAFYTEVYDNIGGNVPHTVDLAARILSEDGKQVLETTDSRSSKDLDRSKGGGFGYSAELPLAGLAPGRYLLRVEARARTKDVEPVTRDVLFTIVPTPAGLQSGAGRE